MFGGLTFYKLIARAIVILTSLPVHEAAHAYAAYKMGDDTARYRRRISLNPFEHIDPMGALMILFVGVGWAKPVPINSFNFRDRKKGIIVTSLAGPLSNIALAAVSMVLYKLLMIVRIFLPVLGNILYGPIQVLMIMISANITLAVFNLLPIPPLDGWRIASVLLPPRIEWQIAQYEQQIGMALIFLVFLGAFDLPLSLLSNLLFVVLDRLTYFINLLVPFLR